MAELVKIIGGEIISLKKDSSKTYEEFSVEKDGAKAGSRFVFKLQTRVNDKVDKSPRLFRRCSYFVKTAEDMTKVRNALNLGSIIEVDGRTNRRSFKGKDGNTVWIDEVDVKTMTTIQSQATGNYAQADNDLPF